MLAAGARVGGQGAGSGVAPPARHPKHHQRQSRARRRAGETPAADSGGGGGGERARPPRVRRARPEDVPAIAALERASAPLSAGWTAAQVEEELPRDIAVVLVAESEGEEAPSSGSSSNDAALAGWAAAWRVAGEMQVLAIAVDPSRRRAGIGRALLSELLALAEQEEDDVGASVSSSAPAPPLATLELRADNSVASALYASCGFVEVGRRKGYYDGGRVDAVLLEKPRG